MTHCTTFKANLSTIAAQLTTVEEHIMTIKQTGLAKTLQMLLKDIDLLQASQIAFDQEFKDRVIELLALWHPQLGSAQKEFDPEYRVTLTPVGQLVFTKHAEMKNTQLPSLIKKIQGKLFSTVITDFGMLEEVTELEVWGDVQASYLHTIHKAGTFRNSNQLGLGKLQKGTVSINNAKNVDLSSYENGTLTINIKGDLVLPRMETGIIIGKVHSFSAPHLTPNVAVLHSSNNGTLSLPQAHSIRSGEFSEFAEVNVPALTRGTIKVLGGQLKLSQHSDFDGSLICVHDVTVHASELKTVSGSISFTGIRSIRESFPLLQSIHRTSEKDSVVVIRPDQQSELDQLINSGTLTIEGKVQIAREVDSVENSSFVAHAYQDLKAEEKDDTCFYVPDIAGSIYFWSIPTSQRFTQTFANPLRFLRVPEGTSPALYRTKNCYFYGNALKPKLSLWEQSAIIVDQEHHMELKNISVTLNDTVEVFKHGVKTRVLKPEFLLVFVMSSNNFDYLEGFNQMKLHRNFDARQVDYYIKKLSNEINRDIWSEWIKDYVPDEYRGKVYVDDLKMINLVKEVMKIRSDSEASS